jgi:hypothetical protein
MESRDAGLRLPPSPWALPSDRYLGLAPQHLNARHHLEHAQVEARPEGLLHPHPRHLRLLPLQLYLAPHPLVHLGRPLAVRLRYKDPLPVRESRFVLCNIVIRSNLVIGDQQNRISNKGPNCSSLL